MKRFFSTWSGWFGLVVNFFRTRSSQARQIQDMANLHSQAIAVINSLNTALADADKKAKQERYEKLLALSAIAYQSGGSFVLPKLFLDLVEKGNFQLDVFLDKNGGEYRFVLVDTDSPTPPFEPAEASTDPDFYPDLDLEEE